MKYTFKLSTTFIVARAMCNFVFAYTITIVNGSQVFMAYLTSWQTMM